MYADDTSVVVAAENESELQIKIESTLKQLSKWYKDNKLFINIKKTNILIFKTQATMQNITFEGSVLQYVKSTKLLGICIDADLKWKTHGEKLVCRLNKALFALRRLKNICDVNTLKLIYYAYFESILKYGILFWGNSCYTHEAFLIQKKAVRTLLGLSSRESCRIKFVESNIWTVTNIFIYESLKYVHQNKIKFPSTNTTHYHNLRENNIRQIKCNNNTIYKSFINTSIKLYNTLELSIKELTSTQSFKNKIKNLLSRKAYYDLNEYFQDS